MDWSKKYNEITNGWLKCCNDISNDYPDCNDFEKCVIALRSNNWTYEQIQKKLGMPSKKSLRTVLKLWCPELIDNSKAKEIKISKWESEIYNIVKKNNELNIIYDDENYLFYIKDHTLMFKDWSSQDNIFRNLDDTTQQQLWIAIKDYIND